MRQNNLTNDQHQQDQLEVQTTLMKKKQKSSSSQRQKVERSSDLQDSLKTTLLQKLKQWENSDKDLMSLWVKLEDQVLMETKKKDFRRLIRV